MILKLSFWTKWFCQWIYVFFFHGKPWFLLLDSWAFPVKKKKTRKPIHWRSHLGSSGQVLRRPGFAARKPLKPSGGERGIHREREREGERERERAGKMGMEWETMEYHHSNIILYIHIYIYIHICIYIYIYVCIVYIHMYMQYFQLLGRGLGCKDNQTLEPKAFLGVAWGYHVIFVIIDVLVVMQEKVCSEMLRLTLNFMLQYHQGPAWGLLWGHATDLVGCTLPQLSNLSVKGSSREAIFKRFMFPFRKPNLQTF